MHFPGELLPYNINVETGLVMEIDTIRLRDVKVGVFIGTAEEEVSNIPTAGIVISASCEIVNSVHSFLDYKNHLFKGSSTDRYQVVFGLPKEYSNKTLKELEKQVIILEEREIDREVNDICRAEAISKEKFRKFSKDFEKK